VIIGVISDTHGNVDAFETSLAFFEDADMIVHAGDVLYHPPRLGCMGGYDIPRFAQVLTDLRIPIVIAEGNCDAQVSEELLSVPVQSPYAHVLAEGIGILVTHGHTHSTEGLVDLGRKYRVRYVVCGHTHVPLLEDHGDVVIMNPGSPAIPKHCVDGKPAPSVGIITERGARIVNIEDATVLMEIGA